MSKKCTTLKIGSERMYNCQKMYNPRNGVQQIVQLSKNCTMPEGGSTKTVQWVQTNVHCQKQGPKKCTMENSCESMGTTTLYADQRQQKTEYNGCDLLLMHLQTHVHMLCTSFVAHLFHDQGQSKKAPLLPHFTTTSHMRAAAGNPAKAQRHFYSINEGNMLSI